MSSFLCFICHSTVNADTNEEMREKYREVVGMNLCPDFHLCHICCHVLHKLWLFRSVCVKRSLEYPVLFSEKGTLNLQRNDLEIYTVCSEETCDHHRSHNLNSKFYNINHSDDNSNDNEKDMNLNQYVELHEDRAETEDYSSKLLGYEHDFLEDVPKITDNVNNISQNVDDNNSAYKEDNNFIAEENYFDDTEEYETATSVTVSAEKIEAAEIYEEVALEEHEEEAAECNKESAEKKTKLGNKYGFEKIILSVEEQKAQLERNRREEKYLKAEFKCSNCAVGFLFKDTYQAHMMRHEESNGEHRCGICTLRFASPAVLRSHRARHAERHRCAACARLLTPRQRAAHARACPACPARPARGADRAHCHLCGKVFSDSNSLRQHLKRFHKHDTAGRSYTCSVCAKRFDNPGAVRTHMITHIHKKFECDQCPSTFSSPYTLKQHQKKHTAQEQAKEYCRPCGVAYTSKKGLRAHLRNSKNHQHTTSSCPACARACPTRRALALHVAAAHAGARAHACAACPARYSSRKSLLRHAARHRPAGAAHPARPARQAMCHLCGASFKENNKLNRHLREVCEKDKLEEELSSYYAPESGV